MRKAVLKGSRLLKKCRSYTTSELAGELGVHPRTIHAWRRAGLESIDPNSKPLLYIGETIKAFIKQRNKKAKKPLESSELYCTRCRKGTLAVSESLTLAKPPLGLTNKEVVHLQGVCKTCGARTNRFISVNRILGTFPEAMADGSQSRLFHSLQLPSNINIEAQDETVQSGK